MTYIFATSGAIVQKAGAGMDPNVASSALILSQVSEEAESFINVSTRINYSDTYSGLNADVKMILQECASDIGAMYLINYNMAGYTSRVEAQTMLDFLRDRIEKDIVLLTDKKHTDFITGA